MQNSISKVNEILLSSSPRSTTPGKLYFKGLNQIQFQFQPTSKTIPNDGSILKAKYLNKNPRKCSKTEEKFYILRASQPLNSIALSSSNLHEEPEVSQYSDLTHYRKPIRNVAYAKIMQKYNVFHTRNASKATFKTPILYESKGSSTYQFTKNNNSKLRLKSNNQNYPQAFGRSQDKKINFSLMNFKSNHKKIHYRTKTNQYNNPENCEESIVFKINPYIDSSSKYILNKFRENLKNESELRQNSRMKFKTDSESALRFLIPLFNLKFAENKSFFRKILKNPSIMEKEKIIQEKIYKNKPRYKIENHQHKTSNKNHLFVKIQRKGVFSSTTFKNHQLIHKSSKIDLAKIAKFGDINIKKW